MNIRLRNARASDLNALKKLWTDCFFEKPEATELFFERNLSYTHGYIAEAENKITAAVYLLDCTLNGKKAHYLCGAATLRTYRKQGIMSALIEYALNDAKSRGDAYSVLFPADEGLYGFYARLGYLQICAARRVTLSRKQLADGAFPPPANLEKPDFERLQKACLKDNFLLQNNSFIDFAVDYYAVYGVKSVYSKNCFAIIEENGGAAMVHYAIYNDIKELKSLLLNSTSANEFVITGKCDNALFANSPNEKYGMIRALDENGKAPANVYIGVTLN